MTDSQKLITEYVENGSEAAFRELVSHYINLVYSRPTSRSCSPTATPVWKAYFSNFTKSNLQAFCPRAQSRT